MLQFLQTGIGFEQWQTSRHRVRVEIWIERALCVSFAALQLWKGIIPGWHSLNTDFPNYYLVARLLRESYSLDRIYDWIWLQRIKDHWGLNQNLVGFAGLTPFSALPVVPLSIYSVLTAKRLWIVVNILLLASCAELLYRSTALNRRRIWLLCMLAVIPLSTNFLFGQMHLFVLFWMTLAWFFFSRNRDLACGLSIALAGSLKVYPLCFVLLFLLKRRWYATASTLVGTILIVVTGGVSMGWKLLHIYATQILPRSMQGEILDPFNLHAASGAALFHRLFLFDPVLNSSPIFDSSSAYAVLYPVWLLAVFLPVLVLTRPSPSHPYRDQLEWAAFLLALLILSPVPSSYHFVALILSVVLLADFLVRYCRLTLLLVSVSIYFLISIIGFISFPPYPGSLALTLLAVTRLWLLIALYVLCALVLWQSLSKEARKPYRFQAALVAAFALMFLSLGITSYRRHLAHREQQISRQLSGRPETYLAISPRPLRTGFAAVTMRPDGYRVVNQTGDAVAIMPGSFVDQLSFTTNAGSAYIELADVTGSRIVQASDGTSIISDAESPVVSADGTHFAFIRERKGTGSLWELDTAQSPGGPSPLPRSLITDPQYDVRSASFFHSDDILFVAQHSGKLRLFLLQPGHGPVLFIDTTEEVGAVAASPDKRLIALTELVKNRWQLALLNVESRRRTLLTFGDCNAFTPAWMSPATIIYATDCGRAYGLTGLASIDTIDYMEVGNTEF